MVLHHCARYLDQKLKNFKIEFEIFRNGVENTKNNKKYPINTIKNKLIKYNNYGLRYLVISLVTDKLKIS